MRRDVLIALEEAARLDTLPIDACRPNETVTPNFGRFAALFAESERRLTSASETSSS
jgi:hypothetical protein